MAMRSDTKAIYRLAKSNSLEYENVALESEILDLKIFKKSPNYAQKILVVASVLT